MIKFLSRLFITSFILFSCHVSANGLYIAAEAGPYFQFNIVSSVDIGEDAEYKAGANSAVNVGYAFGVFHLEALAGSLGDTGFEYSSDFEYQRDTSYVGVAARWKWRWFSFRFGVLSVTTKGEVIDSSGSDVNYTYNLDDGTNSYTGSLFSLGVQFPIAERFNLYIESTGISWMQDDDEIAYEEDELSGTESLSESQVLSIINFGLRFYFGGAK